MVKNEITTCEKELAKIKMKAEKRHKTYMKNKKPKGPSKNDVIIALQAQVEELKQYIKEVEPEVVTEQLEQSQIVLEVETVAEQLNGVLPRLEVETEQLEQSQIVLEPEVVEPVVDYDDIYKTSDDVIVVDNPLKTCQYKESIYTLDFMIEQINELSWKSDAIRDIVSYSVKVMYPLMENPYLPTCIVCLEKLVINLDYVETETKKKKIYFQCLMVLIRRLEIDLKPNVIKKYKQIYENYRD